MFKAFFTHFLYKSWHKLKTLQVYVYQFSIFIVTHHRFCCCFWDIAVVAYLVYWTPNVFVFLWITPLSPSLSSSPSSPKALKVKQEDGARESFKEIREPLTSLGRRWAVSKGGWKKPHEKLLKLLFNIGRSIRGPLWFPGFTASVMSSHLYLCIAGVDQCHLKSVLNGCAKFYPCGCWS